MAWSHFRVLLPCRSQAERDFYARAADDRGWSVRELKDTLAADLYGQARERGSAVLDTDTGIPLPPLRPRRGRLYTYRLVAPGGTRGVPPDRPVVDGDTLIATIDCGFERHISQRLRLRGIDAAELYSRAGQRARDALADLLAGSRTLIVATKGTDFVWGARQTGKSTLLRKRYPGSRWVDELGAEVDLDRLLNHGYLPRTYEASRPGRWL